MELTIDIIALKQIWGIIKAICNIYKWGPRLIYGWNYLFSKPYSVIVYGASGVGKTEFCRALLERDIECTDAPRTVIHQVENLILNDGHKIRLYDLSGHISYKMNRNKVIETIARQKSYGIINVVSFGYHEVPNAQNLKTFKVANGDEKSYEIDTQYIKENLQREFEQAKEWHTGSHLSTNIGWIITVVNKADIWFAKYDQVMEYYQSNGEYSKNLFGNNVRLVKYVYPYSSIISPFCKKPMVIEFGERKKLEMHENLKKDLLRLVKDEM